MPATITALEQPVRHCRLQTGISRFWTINRAISLLFIFGVSLSFSQATNSAQQVYSETPTGQIDGVNTTFFLQNTPSSVQSVMVFRNGIRQKPGADYFVSGNVITFVSLATPAPGDSLLVDYVIGNYPPLNPASASVITKNLVPDSDLKLPTTYWIGAAIPISKALGADGGNAFVYTGTGAPSGWLVSTSAQIPVTPGTVYTFSGYIDESSVIGGGGPLWGVYNSTVTANLAGLSGPFGTKGRLSTSFMVPAGVTSVVVICDTNNTVIAANGRLAFSNPQLEIGSQATVYKPNLLDDVTGYIPASAIGGSTTLTTKKPSLVRRILESIF